MTPTQRKAWREENERLMAEFAARGGRIQEIPAGVSMETPKSRWQKASEKLFKSKSKAA